MMVLSLSRERVVGQCLSREQFEQRVSEQEGILPVVEPERELVGVGLKVLGRKLVVGADDGPLEQRPGRLDSVGGHVPANPLFLGVVDGLMPGVLILDALVPLALV